MSSIEVARLRAEAQTCRNVAVRMSLNMDRERLIRMAQRLEAAATKLERAPSHTETEAGGEATL